MWTLLLSLLGRRTTDSAISLIVKGIAELEKVVAANERKKNVAEARASKVVEKAEIKKAKIEQKAFDASVRASNVAVKAATETERAARIKAKLEELVS